MFSMSTSKAIVVRAFHISYKYHPPDTDASAHWFDHSRDLLNMVNHFRDSMSRPIIGIGHSMGCTQL